MVLTDNIARFPWSRFNCGGPRRSWLGLLRLLMMKIMEVTALCGYYTMVPMTLNAFDVGTQADA